MRIDLYDTTLRDGSQGEGVDFSVQDKLDLVAKLDDFGVDFIEGGYPLSNPKDAEFFRAVRRLKLKHAKLAAFGMTRRRGVAAAEDVGLKALLDAGTEVVTVVGKTWDLHVTDVLAVSLEENLAMISDSVRHLVNNGRRVVYDAEHFFDGTKANQAYALRTLAAAREAGAELVALCDTNGGSQPGDVARLVELARKTVGAVGIHAHNDGDLATANSLAAVAAGATQVQGTINGIGERCGNADLICVAANLALKLGHEVLRGAESLRDLAHVSRFVRQLANLADRNGQPFVGRSAFAHKGGMHVHAVEKAPHSYEHLDPALVGNVRRVLMSEQAGRSNVQAMSRGGAALTPEQTRRVLERVQTLEHEGWQFDAAPASYELLVLEELGRRPPLFESASYRIITEEENGVPVTEATVKVRCQGQTRHTVADGDGPVNALDRALRMALADFYPELADTALEDFKVRVVNPRAGTAARVRATIETRAGRDGAAWSTVGVHENIIEASWQALTQSFEHYVLARRGG